MHFYWFLAALIAVGAALRFSTLTQQSFWFDEGATWLIVAHSFGHAIVTVPRTESTPWTYYVVLWVWTRVFGLGEFGLRSLSAVFGLVTIWIDGLIGKRLFGARAGLATAALTTVSPIMIYYSQEARAYSMLIMACALSLLLLLRAGRDLQNRRLLAWAVASAVAVSIHYYAAFVVAPEAVWLLIRAHRLGSLTTRRAAIIIGPPLATGLALLPLLLHQDDGRAAFIATGPLPGRLAALVKEDILGLQIPFNTGFKILGLPLVAVLLGLIALRASRQERTRLVAPASVAIGAVALAVVAALVGYDFVNTRNMLVVWPALVVVLAAGAGVRGAGRTGVFCLLGLCAVMLACWFVMVASPYYQRDNWRGVAAALGPQPTAVRVIVGDTQADVSLSPFMRGLSQFRATDARVDEVDVFEVNEIFAPASRPPVARRLPGFRLTNETHTGTFTVFQYRSRVARMVSRKALRRLSLQEHESGQTILEQSGR